ncbi:MAG: hypothetical protein UR39_C0016G0001 [Candidatus Woesebacteria bacterium GW2011_GWA1_33_30]|uniref:Uncharacterized protein n=1 Tax=Candidatus Woesebacteria bacterium GW2011_GWA2_33_28 TaxID=1618561 RepID=A0A0G0CAE0_9BACT|nr:MAG: hypothetical protein UR39_C0016G0001 [Candidatus Woesebacteria bacterium GW2011_GWA1_33_30]KKP48105.1 MAG: hypothetical protein UR38_C0002G0208 [Candidatus Woesebacteria bacterium GW2011_GWA2_33_28]KKP50191.1 MAG: hypothetical protein UR40_C0002G0208 [Microgenomates group bacterium GW2011_GWC1_33_32]KKP51961.1 MAG: hypothetical protein UR44_C0006G0207 [Candidatus Woesebacteria bacterium GW2011_GWB1_33_38]KKP58252.1 MAG: hypothetical protein UR48_C0006G0001 [Microgenomates group bacteriu
MSDPEHNYQTEYFQREEKELLPFLRDRGLTKGISDPSQAESYSKNFNNALNEYSVWVNARGRKQTIFQALHNLLTLKIRRDAHEKGYNSTLR